MLLASTPWKLLRDDVNSAQLFPSLSSSFATTASTSSMRALLPAVISWVPPKFSASSILSFAGRSTFLCRAACRTRLRADRQPREATPYSMRAPAAGAHLPF